MQKLFLNPVAALIISIITLVFWISLYQTGQEIRNSTKDSGVLQQEIDQIASEVSLLEVKIDQAGQSQFKEKIARDELLMQLPGERVIKLPDVELPSPTSAIQPELTPWQKWQALLL